MTREELFKAIREDYERKGVWACKSNTINMQLNFEMLGIILEALEQEPCENAISRQAVIDALNKTSGIRGDALKALYDLPPVTPQPKMGRWIVNEWGNISCSECGCTALYDKVYPGESVFGKAIRVKSNFCPTCGAKMKGSKR